MLNVINNWIREINVVPAMLKALYVELVLFKYIVILRFLPILQFYVHIWEFINITWIIPTK